MSNLETVNDLEENGSAIPTDKGILTCNIYNIPRFDCW